MARKVKLTKHVDYEKLKEMYLREKDGRVKERLLAILEIYAGKSIAEVAGIVKRSEPSIKRWIKRWNEYGYKGLIPKFTGGPKPKMNDEEWDKVVNEISGKGMTIKDVVAYLKEKYNIVFGYGWVQRVLRNKKNVVYGKPYIENEKQPADAEDILKKKFLLCFYCYIIPLLHFLMKPQFNLTQIK